MMLAAFLTGSLCLGCFAVGVIVGNGDATMTGAEWIFVPGLLLIAPSLILAIFAWR